jgi:selenocysteine lyase/cysteine desulfurase
VALPWLAGLDMTAVRAHCARLADTVRKGLGMPPTGSAIVAVHRPEAGEKLAAAGVVSSVRAAAVRLAFHLYNSDDDAARVVDALT